MIIAVDKETLVVRKPVKLHAWKGLVWEVGLRTTRRMGHFLVAVSLAFEVSDWCSTIVREMSLICIKIRNSFPFEWLCTRTRFETETCSNSEMGHCTTNFVISTRSNFATSANKPFADRAS